MAHEDQHITIDIDRLNGGQTVDRACLDINTTTNADCDKSQANKLSNRNDETNQQQQQQQQRPVMFHERERFAQYRPYNDNDNDSDNVNSSIVILNDSQFPRHDFGTAATSGTAIAAATATATATSARTINKRYQLCFSFIKLVPVMLTFTLLLWSYYAFVFYFCFYYVQSIFERLLYLSIYHLLLMLLTWSFCKTTFTEIPKVPQEFVLPLETLTRLSDANSEIERKHILENFAQTLPTVNRTCSGSVRYCAFCNLVKPDRAHHCRMCGYCVLKMDHHCPWVNTCVCFYNYKYFLLYIGYALVYCIFIMTVTLKYFLEQWEELSKLRSSANIHVVLLFLISLALIISLFSLFSYHCYLVLKNRTTHESFRTPIFIGGPNKNGFDLGRFENFKEVFGTQPKYWFLPICTLTGNGVIFATK